MPFESINPTTGELLATYPEHNAHEVDARLQEAWDGWQRWSLKPLAERTAFLNRLANLLEARADEHARLITLEMGKPLSEALGEVKRAAAGASPQCSSVHYSFVEQSSALKIGDPMLPETKLGPQARKDLLENCERQVGDAVAAGARVLLGGKRLEGPGYFFPPTVLVDLPPNAPIAREEFFGPVALVFTFESEEEAIRRANDSDFGLGATVMSQNTERANYAACRLEAGAVFINDFVRSDARAPFGGVKASGFGRELGALGARELTNPKLIWEPAS